MDKNGAHKNKSCDRYIKDCCTAEHPCGVGAGDCDYNWDCQGDLVCGQDNCGGKWDWDLDCCEKPPPKPPTYDTYYSLDLKGFQSTGPTRVLDELASSRGTDFRAPYIKMARYSSGSECPAKYSTAGWIDSCSDEEEDFLANLFGLNLQVDTVEKGKGIFWSSFGGSHTSLAKVLVSIKPNGPPSLAPPPSKTTNIIKSQSTNQIYMFIFAELQLEICLDPDLL